MMFVHLTLQVDTTDGVPEESVLKGIENTLPGTGLRMGMGGKKGEHAEIAGVEDMEVTA